MTGESSAAYFHCRFSNTVLSKNGNVDYTLCTYVLSMVYGMCVKKSNVEYVTKSHPATCAIADASNIET
jgi:hypothetical protein